MTTSSERDLFRGEIISEDQIWRESLLQDHKKHQKLLKRYQFPAEKALTLGIVAALFCSVCTGCSLQNAMQLMEQDQTASGSGTEVYSGGGSSGGESLPGGTSEHTADSGGSADGVSGWESISGEGTSGAGTSASGEGTAGADSTASSGISSEDGDAGALPVAETENWYAYNTLTSGEQTVYRQVLRSIQNREKIRVSTLDTALLDEVYTCVMADHPELFWVSGYRYTAGSIGGVVTSLSFEGTWTFTEEEQYELQEQLDSAVQTFLADLPGREEAGSQTAGGQSDAGTQDSGTSEELLSGGMDDYGRLKYCFDRIVRETEYDPDAENSQNILSVFLNHRSVCNGYAKALQLVCMEVGIPCTFVTGTASSGGGKVGSGTEESVVSDAGSSGDSELSGNSGGDGSTPGNSGSSGDSDGTYDTENHAWNLVLLDGAYYYVDVTWGDPQFDEAVEEDVQAGLSDWVNYDYLCVTTSDLVKTHAISRSIPMPECTATADNYYVRAGTYMTEYTPEVISAALRQAQADGSGIAAMRFATDELFQYAENRLMDERVIYEYLPGVTSLRYTSSEDMGTLTVFLRS